MKKKRKTKKDKKKAEGLNPIIKFCLLFFILLIAITFIYFSLDRYLDKPLTKLEEWTAFLTASILNLLGIGAHLSSRVISMDNLSIEVIAECTGLFEILIFLAAMIAYPANYKKKLLGALYGFPLLYGINIVRMVFISAIANYYPKSFEFLHLYFWQITMILIILSVWVWWIQKIVKYERKTSPVYT